LAGPDRDTPGIAELKSLASGFYRGRQDYFPLAGVDSAAGYFQGVSGFGNELLLSQKFGRSQVNHHGALIGLEMGNLGLAAVIGLAALAGDGFQSGNLPLNGNDLLGIIGFLELRPGLRRPR
jgi:hypothetical protein